MQIQFAATVPAGTQIVARVVNQDGLPADLETTLAHGARAARFAGKAQGLGLVKPEDANVQQYVTRKALDLYMDWAKSTAGTDG